MPKGRDFIDSKGAVGRSFAVGTGIEHVVGNRASKTAIRFVVLDDRYIGIRLPQWMALQPIRVTKKNGIALAHWLLDKCSQ
jgi:hypothetical protein